MKKLIALSKEELAKKLWSAEPKIKSILTNSKHMEEARYLLFDYLNRMERDLYNMKSDTSFINLNIVKKRRVRECIHVLSNTFRSESEHLTKSSALGLLFDLAKNKKGTLDKVDKGFLLEFLVLFLGITGKYSKHLKTDRQFEVRDGREAAIERSTQLDDYAETMTRYFKRYHTGFDHKILRDRNNLKKEILAYFGADESDWKDYLWHMRCIIKDVKTLSAVVKLEEGEYEGVKCAEENKIPFEITPYYLSLFSKDGICDYDRAVRAQVIPSPMYCRSVMENRKKGADMDFMGEKSTSPIDGVTRRYPGIIIIKTYDACPQICVYCQRNWEVKNIDAVVKMPEEKTEEIITWINDNKNITEILVTGGDPLTLNNNHIEWLIGRIAGIKHIERIRIGTRTPVALPCRINEGFLKILKKYHEWGKREICIVTHFEHPTEMTPDSLEAIKKIREIGVNVYNQQVFTYYNSKRFETCFLRKTLKVSGVDPYYSFNTLGKEETIDFRVPIARIKQERKEEARLLPGLVRTDEPVFNVPKLGKSHLRAWQDHEVIMVLPDGRRVYRFYSWESELSTGHNYLYTDVSISDYLKRLDEDGVNINDYRSIYHYF